MEHKEVGRLAVNLPQEKHMALKRYALEHNVTIRSIIIMFIDNLIQMNGTK
jgi:hypothetical protein